MTKSRARDLDFETWIIGLIFHLCISLGICGITGPQFGTWVWGNWLLLGLFGGDIFGEYITQICHILREKEEVEIVILRP